MSQKRKYSKDYLKFCFTTLMCNGIEQPQSDLCHVVWSADTIQTRTLPENKTPNMIGKKTWSILNEMRLLSSFKSLTTLVVFLSTVHYWLKHGVQSRLQPNKRKPTCSGKL